MLAIVVLAMAALAAGCDDSETVEKQFCDPGSTQTCPCPDGKTQGIQYCNEDGTDYYACANCPVIEKDVVEQDVEEPEDTKEVEPEEDVQPEVEEKPDIVQPKICLLNNCTEDVHCAGCSDNRVTCFKKEKRCVACNPETGAGCKPPEVCSAFGICNLPEKTCPTDASGVPQVVCVSNEDCSACSPMNQICDTKTHKCQACIETNTSACLASDVCLNGKCSSKCPKACNIDNDCQFCGPADSPAHACNMHKCSECSATWPCPAGLVCLPNGVCYPPCGLPGPVSGTCVTDKDCNFCGDPKNPGTYKCKKPLNDPDGHGTCIPSAAGCSDLGAGTVVLPPPWGDYTQTCSKDEDCSTASITLNVGKVIRDMAGVNEVMGVAITDANVSYAMPECAEIKITDTINCGVCVPCNEDKDCKPIAVDPLLFDLFSEDPLAALAGALLMNMLYGDAVEHNLNFYCQAVGLGYGICAPCANPLQACGKTDEGGGSGKCEHEVCTEGTALDPSCGACAKEVCANDSYCCTTSWDATCVKEVDTFCATPCSGEGGCDPDVCTNADLPAQDPMCSPCVEAVCTADPFCCNKESGAWDSYCVTGAEAEAACADLCGTPGACVHDECVTGGPLAADCSECATAVCGYDSWCCTNEWDSQCVNEAKEDADCPCI
jgi:hypothetical protein